MKSDCQITLVGNPNCGKTAVFNLLTGLSQKVSNYPGTTVSSKIASVKIDDKFFEICDLPGTYSVVPETIDEEIVTKHLFDINQSKSDSVIISVVDASNLSRNLFFTSQIIEFGVPVIIVLNMMDRVRKRNLDINIKELRKIINVSDIIPMCATTKEGIDDLNNAIYTAATENYRCNDQYFSLPETVNIELKSINNFLTTRYNYSTHLASSTSIRLVTSSDYSDFFISNLRENQSELREIINNARKNFTNSEQIEAQYRYEWLDSIFDNKLITEIPDVKNMSRSEKIDKVLLHKIWGPIFFITILYLIFQTIFSWSSIPMNWIDNTIIKFGNIVSNSLNPSILTDLLVEGVIGGVGAIVIFLPQIIFLILFLSILEDSGYMTRVAYMMDKMMNSCGLHGRSVLPLMSGYACAIPGILSTRTIQSWRDRLITILVLPLFSCSARLPIYTLMIGAFIPNITILGFIKFQALVMVAMYFLGTITAFIIAKILSFFIKEREKSSFLIEMPPYRMPLFRSVFHDVYSKAKDFILDAGKIIMSISIVLWFLASFPDYHNENRSIENSYAGKIGKFIEPAIAPLGFDWKLGIGIITSFAAREVMVSTLATIYNVESTDGSGLVKLSDAMMNDKDGNGNNTFNSLIAISLMVFYVYAAQCMATFAVIKTETNSWKWPAFMIIYMTLLAYIGSLLTFQIGSYLL